MPRPTPTKTPDDLPDIAAPKWEAARPQTMVDLAVAAIISGATRGVILPGDRIVEAELAKALGMSRVPIREALRILESQGVVTSAPYKGIRLMEVSHERLEQVLDVRANLEILAARRAIEAGRNGPAELARLRAARDELALVAARKDVYAFALADAAFHRTLCELGGNPVLSVLWESLARQVTVIGGLATLGKPMAEIVAEHDRLIDAFASGDVDMVASELHDHIVVFAHSIDFDAIIAERRKLRT
ncbi:GntR family transcriptional regulator [Devosia limi DSM 17137]|uniref:GntR family transcriptional regulator n=1 Tax=Devosia limi DSM 17137 TaxID=1121477 RepID=A0A0F5LS69_9HYPH|nr:GntR family transcriptional regulator [Devosia limi]KKB85178.1 GntR family transcriptional regulator [Devosia limi DSM 17137]SHF76341.1 transcriptional regulator, GntR family [Devosia limi DSM 17137]